MNSNELLLQIISGKQLSFTDTFNAPIELDFTGQTPALLGRITFKDCTFNQNFELIGLESEHSSIRFENCVFSKDDSTYIKDLKLSKLKFRNCKFYQSISIRKCELPEFYIQNCEMEEGIFYISEITSISTNFTWDGDEQKFSLNVDAPNIEDLYVASRGNVKTLSLYDVKIASINGSFGTVVVQTKNCDSITIQSYTPERQTNPDLEYGKIDQLRQIDQIFNGKLRIEELEIENLYMYNVDSPDSISLLELKIKTAQFYDVNIKSFYWNQLKFSETLKIERGDLSSLKIANVQWPERKKKVSNSYLDKKVAGFYLIRRKWLNEDKKFDSDDIIEMQYEREVYRQLKSASSSINNHIESLEFYKNEMRLYWKELRINGGIPVWDRILIFLNRWSSNFGQSWALPLLWLFIFHTTLYFWIINFQLSCDWKAFSLGFGQYFELLNPVHKTPDYVKGFAIGLEFFMRVIDGFLIYHFIRATRKYGKV